MGAMVVKLVEYNNHYITHWFLGVRNTYQAVQGPH